MIGIENQPATTADTVLLQNRLRAIGIVTLHCDVDGVIDHKQSTALHKDVLLHVFSRTPLLIAGLKKAAKHWQSADAPQPLELVPGLWVCGIPKLVRRRRAGYLIAVIPTFELVGSEHLAAMCQASHVDCTLVNQLLTTLPPATAHDVPRLAALVRFGHDDQTRLISENQSTENLGQQLAESYEEINLLYTIIQNMTVRERPEHFVRAACNELLQTLPYRWIAALLAEDGQRLKRLAGRVIICGECDVDETELASLLRPLLAQAEGDKPRVLDPKLNPDDAAFATLGQPVMLHPITADNTVIGLFLAGDKIGSDRDVSSVDQKLLGATASHTGIFLENAALVSDLNSMFLGTLEALTASIDAKDRYTCGHSRRVALLTKQLAISIDLDQHTVERMHIAGLVHDVGKIGVPESVLLKPGRLDEGEFEWIRRHPEMGYRILRDIPQLDDVLPGVLYHHERWDGKGYPHGLAAERIPLMARLIALADSFDAMSSTRTYRPAMGRAKVLEEIENCSGTQFDPELVPHFIDLEFAEYDRRVLEDQKAEEQGAYVPLTELREFTAGSTQEGEKS